MSALGFLPSSVISAILVLGFAGVMILAFDVFAPRGEGKR
ncbi:hypothetical protein QOZ99_002777 [Angulomicrobium amanitiforme]|uniref:DUF3149 domain-containing protein n=1 Tax=Ancylobacter amanitiformis TaxID=217069 RepID=A0ABU0LT60_9HYPH|nr:hypothetical protein [Ancylobacter amanitiformis]